MEIRKLNHNTYDIFLFNGWENHTRIRCTRRGPYVVAGKRISRALLEKLESILVRGFKPTVGQHYDVGMTDLSIQ